MLKRIRYLDESLKWTSRQKLNCVEKLCHIHERKQIKLLSVRNTHYIRIIQ
jgi:hypothetical protein